MSKLMLISIFALIAFSSWVSAEMKKGSVGGGGQKGYFFVMDGKGQAQITLIYDNYSSDLDLAAGVTDSNGDVTLIGVDVSTMQNFAQTQFGIDTGRVVYILVKSYRGGSPFRIYISSNNSEIISSTSLTELNDVEANKIANQLKAIKN